MRFFIICESIKPLAPGAAPRNLSVMPISATIVSVQWEAVERIERNGEIIVYEITYTPQQTFGGSIGEEAKNVSGSELSTNITGLQEFLNYSISIRAYTSIGAGPDSDVVMIRTLPSGMFGWFIFLMCQVIMVKLSGKIINY